VTARRALGAVAAALAGAGCADSIEPVRPDAGPPADARDGEIVPTGLVTTVPRGDGTWDTLIDATSEEAWTLFDLDAGGEDPDPAAWDLGLRRASIKSNGGVSGTAGVAVAILAGVDFAGVILPPTTPYRVDEPDGDDPNPDPEYALKEWFAYDDVTHVLTPKTDIDVVRTSEAVLVKLEILAYYDPAGTGAWYLVHWAPLAAP
jgi:hypothetical protein